jgi:hypothetical protein
MQELLGIAPTGKALHDVGADIIGCRTGRSSTSSVSYELNRDVMQIGRAQGTPGQLIAACCPLQRTRLNLRPPRR